DIAYRVRFSSPEGRARTATLRRVQGAQAAGTGDGGQVIVEGAAVSTGREARVTEAGGYRFFAGWRSDPFFFDRRGAVNNLQFTGEHAGGYTPEEARRVARTLLPDLLPYDPARPASFPDNGRTLTDDAVDAFLAILTNGKVTADK